MRAFTSAPILNRSDPLTLETVDGIYVLIDSCLNKVRTEENGFPYEVRKLVLFIPVVCRTSRHHMGVGTWKNPKESRFSYASSNSQFSLLLQCGL